MKLNCDQVLEFVKENGYKQTDIKPAIGSTGYLDRWNDSYGTKVWGYDEWGRLYFITDEIELIGPETCRFRVCVFQRYTDSGSIFVSTSKYVRADVLFDYIMPIQFKYLSRLVEKKHIYALDRFECPVIEEAVCA